MNKKISSRLAIFFIIFLAVFVTVYTWVNVNDFDPEAQNEMTRDVSPSSGLCKARAFKGMAKIKVWQTVKNDRVVLAVSSDDTEKLPLKSASDFQLIDPTPEVEKKLSKSSQDEPVELKISGFASLCNGMYLASLEYKDGIFKPYIIK